MSIGGIVGRDRRRPSLPPELIGRLFLAWLAISTLLLLTHAGAIWERGIAQPTAAATAIALPLAMLACVIVLVGRIAYRLFDEEVAGLAALTCGLAVPLLQQLSLLRVEQHGWQVVGALFAANGLMARDARRGGWAIGGGLAVCLAISSAVLPLIACFVAVTALKWLRNRCDRWWMAHTMTALALVSAALFAASGGLSDVSRSCGGLSAVHVAMFAWGAAITALNAWLEPHPKAFTVAGMGVTVGGALLIAWQAAPQCTLGTIQVQPLWAGGPLAAAHALAVPLLGLAAAVRLIGPASDWLRRWWIDYALLLLAAIVLAVVLGWGSAIACALAAVPLGWQLREWTRAARNARQPRRRALVLAGMSLALAPAAPLSLLLVAAPGQAARTPAAAEPVTLAADTGFGLWRVLR
jgi:hypothetical protein